MKKSLALPRHLVNYCNKFSKNLGFYRQASSSPNHHNDNPFANFHPTPQSLPNPQNTLQRSTKSSSSNFTNHRTPANNAHRSPPLRRPTNTMKIDKPFKHKFTTNVQAQRHSMNGKSPTSQPMFFPDDYINQDINQISKEQQTGVSLKQMFEMGRNPAQETLLKNAQFLWKELPIRIAKRVVELRSLPYALSKMPSIEEVANIYVQSFNTIRSLPKPVTAEDDETFSDVLGNILDNHSNVVPKVAQGLIEMKSELDSVGFPLDDCPYLADFLNRFYMARIGIRFLIGHHVELHRTRHNLNTSFVGIIDGSCQPAFIADDAINDASRVCQQTLGDYPEVNVHDPNNVTCRYVSFHLHYMLFELLKNSMRAVVETHKGGHDFPPIDIVIADGAKEITIKISDQGGGIKRRDVPKILSYTYTTARTPTLQTSDGRGLISAPMAGFGYGLPISTLYANYFGGDMKINSMDGYGTDAYLFLLKLGDYNETLN